jgi:predicted metal-dependent HD superfamily phosphohydrolase
VAIAEDAQEGPQRDCTLAAARNTDVRCRQSLMKRAPNSIWPPSTEHTDAVPASDDMNPRFEVSWNRAWTGLLGHGNGLVTRGAVLASYAQAHRKYHTQQHLLECLTLFETLRDTLGRPHEVEMALWFHDAIYDVMASDNEERSAAWAGEVLRSAGVEREAVGRIEALILVTKHDVIPRTSDEAALADIDLAILGAPEPRFAEYERQIREEYAHVPAWLFRLKRRSILKAFLARPALHGTPSLRQQFEARARANLANAIGGNAD